MPRKDATRPLTWPDAVEEVFSGDLAVALASVTPAHGVVITPLTNFALHDRARGTASVLTSLGAWRKLRRIERNPHVALAFHTREHGFADQPEYVLAHGTASFSWTPDRARLESIEENWVRFMGRRRNGPLWDRWMRVYHWERVEVAVDLTRVVVWSDLRAVGEPSVHGAPLPGHPAPPQRPPARGTGPRVDHRRAAARLAGLPHRLLGWVGPDGFPMVVPVATRGSDDDGILLDAPAGLIPPAGRRAGLTGHRFSQRVLGQVQQIHTGWLDGTPPSGPVRYAPHTETAYRLPPSPTLYRLGVGAFTRLGYRQLRRTGIPPP